jgi:hypothetical protein
MKAGAIRESQRPFVFAAYHIIVRPSVCRQPACSGIGYTYEKYADVQL